MLLFNYLITGQKDEVLLVQQAIKKLNQPTEIVEVRCLEFKTMLLFNIKQSELEVIEHILEFFRALLLLLIEFQRCNLIGWVF
jgi:hypothetical protein